MVAYAHPELDWTYNRDAGQREYTRAGKVKYYTCSVYCAAMVVQLDHHIETFADLTALLTSGNDVVPFEQTPARTVRCYCCGSDIKPN